MDPWGIVGRDDRKWAEHLDSHRSLPCSSKALASEIRWSHSIVWLGFEGVRILVDLTWILSYQRHLEERAGCGPLYWEIVTPVSLSHVLYYYKPSWEGQLVPLQVCLNDGFFPTTRDQGQQSCLGWAYWSERERLIKNQLCHRCLLPKGHFNAIPSMEPSMPPSYNLAPSQSSPTLVSFILSLPTKTKIVLPGPGLSGSCKLREVPLTSTALPLQFPASSTSPAPLGSSCLLTTLRTTATIFTVSGLSWPGLRAESTWPSTTLTWSLSLIS